MPARLESPIKINGQHIKQPSEASIGRFNLTKSGRVASGKMTMDLVAKKRRIDISYKVIAGHEMRQILDLIDGDTMFFTVEWEEEDGWKSMKAYVGEIPTTYFRREMGWYWTNVQFALIEQ
jgi:hypothetical protein